MSFWRRPLVQGILMTTVIVFALSYLLGQIVVSGCFDGCAARGDDAAEAETGFEKEAVSGEPGTFQILVVPVHGVIYRGEESGFWEENYADADTIVRMLEQALEDDRIKAVVLELNTPGGEVVATDMIYRKVRQLSESGKPVIASMSVVAASGGYYIASGADRIVAHPLCTTGSIGVIISALKYFELQKKIGVSSENYTTGRFKDILSGSRPTTPEEKAIVEAHLKGVYDRFAEVVSQGRKLPLEEVKSPPIGDGRIMLGSEAKKLKLVDENGTLEDALALARNLASLHRDCRVVRYREKKKSFLELMSDLSKMSSGGRSLKVELPVDPTLSKLNSSGGRYYMVLP